MGQYLAGAARYRRPGSVRDPGHGAGAGLLGGSGGPPVQRGPPVGDVRLRPAVRVPGRLRPGDPAPALRDLRSLSRPAQQDQQDPDSPGGTAGSPAGQARRPSPRTARRSVCRPPGRGHGPSRSARPASRGSDAQPVGMVRVVQVGLADGEHHLVFEGAPAVAKRKYDDDGAGQVRRAVTRGTPQPGGGCAQCKLRTACEALRPRPGILGVTDPEAPPRTWSATNGRYYRTCPAQDHLYRLHLPRDGEYSESAVAGRRYTPGSGGRTVARAASPARCKTSRRCRMTGLPEDGMSPGRRPGVAR